MFNPTEIPSLAPLVEAKLTEAGIEVVPGKVTDFESGRIYCTFSVSSGELPGMTASELYLLYLKPVVEAMGDRAVEYADGCDLCTRALPLPGADSKVVGWRCFKGSIPVNIYIARRVEPDRHQFIIEFLVQKVED
jgi:hypothetical protein